MYIRTKDKIIAFGKKYAYPIRLSNSRIAFTFQELTEDRFEVMKEYNHWEILKQSENLEELCDEFVIDETHYMENDLKEMVLYRDCIAGGLKTTIYGAIWTDKGLIFVAKMNSNGELELI